MAGLVRLEILRTKRAMAKGQEPCGKGHWAVMTTMVEGPRAKGPKVKS